ncbi:MAG: AAA family ATPase, partial [Candidatus Omnitrophota bacterium]
MIDEKEIKLIPYAVSDFNKFRKKNYYYVDKTRYIREIEKKGDYLFFIRPRRFGKSLFLAMLESYYDIIKKDQFDFLFKESDIYRNPTKEKNSYMILKLNFSKVNPEFSMVEHAFLTNVKNTAGSFITKYEKLLNIDIEKATKTLDSNISASEVLDTLFNYCSGKEQKLYVIIDEYDNFANSILSTVGEKAFED